MSGRLVDSQAELDSLPVKTVIRDSYGFVVEKSGARPFINWYSTGDDVPFDSFEFPAVVIWEPES